MIFETCIPPAFVDTDREREILRVPMADCLDQLQLGLAQPHIYPPSYTRLRPASIGELVIFQRIGIAELKRPEFTRGDARFIGGDRGAFQPAFDLVVFRPAKIHGLYGAGATVT